MSFPSDSSRAAAVPEGPAEGRFAARVIAWQRCHGRHGLPWQGTREPYRVWLSEIMLQQTRAETAAHYYRRFLQRFPDLESLASAPLDDVLGLWSGLGYYARARNLHRCARLLVCERGGRFPRTAAELARLPGIGPSTAAAIAAFCHGERAAILDGNVRRVLARVLGFEGDLSRAAPQRELWRHARQLLPADDLQRTMPLYTQGLMDLGALVCTPRRPDCARCPLADWCVARASGEPGRYPVSAPRTRPQRLALWWLHATDRSGRVWLQRRGDGSIWPGLYCLPQARSRRALLAGCGIDASQPLLEHDPWTHVLTHRALEIHVLGVRQLAPRALGPAGRWWAPAQWRDLGMPAPARRFLERAAAGS